MQAIFRTLAIVAVAMLIGAAGTMGGLQALGIGGLPGLASDRGAAPAPVVKRIPPTYFAQLDDVVVSMPPASGQPATSYVQFGMQFSTHDPKAVDAFKSLQPIVRSQILSVLMSQTTQGLQDQSTRGGIVSRCLDIANAVVEKNANFVATPFAGGYITDLVVQDDGG